MTQPIHVWAEEERERLWVFQDWYYNERNNGNKECNETDELTPADWRAWFVEWVRKETGDAK